MEHNYRQCATIQLCDAGLPLGPENSWSTTRQCAAKRGKPLPTPPGARATESGRRATRGSGPPLCQDPRRGAAAPPRPLLALQAAEEERRLQERGPAAPRRPLLARRGASSRSVRGERDSRVELAQLQADLAITKLAIRTGSRSLKLTQPVASGPCHHEAGHPTLPSQSGRCGPGDRESACGP